MKLTDIKIRSVKSSEKRLQLADGKGLVLFIMPNGTKLWRYRYRYAGKANMLSLGEYPQITLSDAREERDRLAKLISNGVDPSLNRKELKMIQKDSYDKTFEVLFEKWFSLWIMGKSNKHTQRVKSFVKNDVLPKIANYPVDTIKPATIRFIISQIVERGTYDTASRVFQYIKLMLSYAKTHEWISSNPAEGIIIRDIIPTVKVKHQEHVAIREFPKLLRDIDSYQGYAVTQHAIKLLYLTFVRTTELIGARWEDFDLENAKWIIPAAENDHEGNRSYGMKMGTPHYVPLNSQALEILHSLHAIAGRSKYLFPSIKGDGKTMSNNTLLHVLYSLGYKGKQTGHGFRGLASTILRENGFKREVVELQLSHLVGDDVERAYNSMELLSERKQMMEWYGNYLDHIKQS